MAERHDIPVVVKGGSTTMWTLTVTKPSPHTIVLALAGRRGPSVGRPQRRCLRCADEPTAEANPSGFNSFATERVATLGHPACSETWAGGYATYLLELGEHRTRPKHVRALDPAPPSEVVTVAEQLAFQEQWRAERSDWARWSLRLEAWLKNRQPTPPASTPGLR
jgi:hypothetical protein